MHLIRQTPGRWAAWGRGRLGGDEKAASMIEYALLLALLAAVCVAALSFLGSDVSSKLSSSGSMLN